MPGDRVPSYKESRYQAVTDAIPLSHPDITDLDIRAVVETLRSGRLSIGPRLEELGSILGEAAEGAPDSILLMDAVDFGGLPGAVAVFGLEDLPARLGTTHDERIG